MLNFAPTLRYYYCPGRVSFRNRINGLSAYVRGVLGCDPADGSVFIFMGASRREVRLLCYDRNGYVLLSKRLDPGSHYRRPVFNPDTGTFEIRWDELVLLVEGVVRTEVRFSGPPGGGS